MQRYSGRLKLYQIPINPRKAKPAFEAGSESQQTLKGFLNKVAGLPRDTELGRVTKLVPGFLFVD